MKAQQTEYKKPRVGFCFECGRRLWGRHYTEKDGHIYHKQCADLNSEEDEEHGFDSECDATEADLY